MATAGADIRNLLFRSNPIPMFLYDGGSQRIRAANDAAIARYGYTCREFRSLTIHGLCACENDSGLGTRLHHEPPSHSLRTHSTKAGKHFTAELRIAPFLHGRRALYLMSAIDISAASGVQLKLIHSEELHRSLVEECPFGIFRVNLTTSRFEQANPSLLQGIGYSLEELRSLNPPDLYVEIGAREPFLSELRANSSVHNFETCFRKKNGGIVRVSLSEYLCTHVETGDQYIQGYVLDISRQRELEEQLSHSQRMEAVGCLAGGVAHDFNNIMQSINLSCELALRNQLNPAIESKLLDIVQQAARATEITRQLLAFSRRQLLQPRVVNINDCVRNALFMLNSVVGVDVTIDMKLDETVDHIFIDPDQLAIVLMHLASNARAAMPQGGQLQISTSTCPGSSDSIKQIFSGPCAVLTVSDTGVGMDEKTLGRIFEPFFSTKNTSVTSGLGLSTVHGIVAQSKGRIECESSRGQGTTFRIYLPFAAAQSTGAAASLASDNSRYRILLAEDDSCVNKYLTSALRKADYSVDSVCNGEEALAAFDQQHYDLVISDIIMPKIGGVELTNRLRQRLPSLPVILISGYSEEASVLQHIPRNQIAFLQKPFPSSQLITRDPRHSFQRRLTKKSEERTRKGTRTKVVRSRSVG
jgi:two-component system cell cycle sensor histidine kinase/response regulator CckA